MKILLYGINFSPELTGIGKYTGEMAAWSVSAGYSGSRWQREEWQGVQVWRCPLWVPQQPIPLHTTPPMRSNRRFS